MALYFVHVAHGSLYSICIGLRLSRNGADVFFFVVVLPLHVSLRRPDYGSRYPAWPVGRSLL